MYLDESSVVSFWVVTSVIVSPVKAQALPCSEMMDP